MKILKTDIEGCYIIEPTVFGDERGFFFESYNQKTFNSLLGFEVDFVQDNVAFSIGKVLRGMHFQKGKDAQAKLVGVHIGEVLDVVVDLRKASPTFGNKVEVRLSSENKRMLFVPRGCAHGYQTISNETLFYYKCDNFYNKMSEGGLMYNDSTIAINWVIEPSTCVISEKDKQNQAWGEIDFDAI